MWAWIDGHMLLIAVLSVPVSYLLVCVANGVLASRHERRGGAR